MRKPLTIEIVEPSRKPIVIRPYNYTPKPRKDYLIEGDMSVPEEVERNKRKAIARAKEIAKETNKEVFVIPCIDFEPNDDVPYYIVEPNGKVKESDNV